MSTNKRKRSASTGETRKRSKPAEEEEEAEEVTHPFASLGGKRYDIILADPPWSYDSAGVNGAAAKQYSTMSDKDIAELPVRDISNPGAFCLMWTTGPKLPQAFDVMKAWGFAYKTVFFVWLKTNKGAPMDPIRNGLGNYTRSACEYVLIGKRTDGKLKLRDAKISSSVGQMIIEPRREHSRKPDVTFDKINEFFAPELSRVELFARESRAGFEAWGNEVGKFDAEEAQEE